MKLNRPGEAGPAKRGSPFLPMDTPGNTRFETNLNDPFMWPDKRGIPPPGGAEVYTPPGGENPRDETLKII